MQLTQLEALLRVVEYGTISRAAEALFLTQPALTARLQGLEQELGQELFARTRVGLHLTDAGRALLPYAERALRAVAEGKQAVDDLAAGRAGKLVLGATGSVSSYVLPSVLKRYRLEHPRVDLVVRTGHSEALLQMVLAETVDLAIVRELQHRDVEAQPLFDDPLVLVAHPSHPCAGRVCTLAEVAAGGLVLFDRASSYYELTHNLFAQAGVEPRTVMEMDNFESAKKMLEQGLGVALLSEVAVRRELELGQLAEVRLADGGPVHRRIVVIRRANAGLPGGVTRAFLDLLRQLTAALPAC